jgi:hypothetical protein
MESAEPVHYQNRLVLPAFSSFAPDRLLSNALSSRVWTWSTHSLVHAGYVSRTGFETILGLVWDLSPESHERVALGVQHQDVPVWQIHSSRIAFADG